MSQENVEFLEGLFAGAADMDRQALLDALPELIAQTCDPEIEWVEDPQRADRRVYRGHEGVRESWERWLENFEEYGTEAERMIDGGDKVLVVAREHGRGRASGATVSQRTYAVVSFRDGKISRYEEFYEEQEALEAAGLRELAMSLEKRRNRHLPDT
jgi:ketosteroid isomerase-like protein